MQSVVCISLKWILIYDHTSKRTALNWILRFSLSMAPPTWDNLELNRLKNTSDNIDTRWPEIYLCNVSEWMVPKFLKRIPHHPWKFLQGELCHISEKQILTQISVFSLSPTLLEKNGYIGQTSRNVLNRV